MFHIHMEHEKIIPVLIDACETRQDTPDEIVVEIA